MADNVDITAGTGTAIATDEVQVSGTNALGHVQFVKLVDGTLNGTDAIGGDATNGLDVDVTRLPALVAGNANIGDVDVASIAAGTNYIGRVRITDGTTDAVVSTTGGLEVTGDVAHDVADGGPPIKVGYKAVAHGANPTAVAAADRTDAYANRHGIPFVMGGHPNIVSLRATYTGAQTDVALVSVAAGTKIVVTQAQVTVSNATTATPSVIIGFGTANTPTTTGVVLAHPGIPGGGGVSRGDGSGILGIGADDADLRITISVPTGGTLDVVVSYFTIES